MKLKLGVIGIFLFLFLLLMMGCMENSALPDALDALLTPDPSPTPTGHPLLNYSCEHPSPDGRFCGGLQDGWGSKVSDENGRVLYSRWNQFVMLIGWTNDSRYLVYYNYPYRGSYAYTTVFDTEKWESRMRSETVVGMNTDKNLIALSSGYIYNLDDDIETPFRAEETFKITLKADWSPNEAQLAFLSSEGFGDYFVEGRMAIFIANTNGENSRIIHELPFGISDLTLYKQQIKFYWVDDQTIQLQDNKGNIYQYEIIGNE